MSFHLANIKALNVVQNTIYFLVFATLVSASDLAAMTKPDTDQVKRLLVTAWETMKMCTIFWQP